jgi:hypothetical protein
VLCPSTNFEAHSITHELEEVTLGAEPTLAAAQTANDCLVECTRQREYRLENIKCLDTFLEPESGHAAFIEVCQEVFIRFDAVCISDGSTPTSGKEIADAVLLRDTIVAILWELQDNSSSLGAVSKGHILHAMILSDLGSLLCSAALYQIQEDTVRF